jgi:hypothetical protein
LTGWSSFQQLKTGYPAEGTLADKKTAKSRPAMAQWVSMQHAASDRVRPTGGGLFRIDPGRDAFSARTGH